MFAARDPVAHEIEQTAASTGPEAMTKIRKVAIVRTYFMYMGLYHSSLVLAMVTNSSNDFIL